MVEVPSRRAELAGSLICCALAALAFASLLVVFIGHKYMVAIPCVAGSTCDEVAKLRISNPLGIPLSLIGASIALANLVSSIGLSRLRSWISNLTIGSGLLSICLQIYIRSSLQLSCIWCLLAALSLVLSGTLNRTLKPPSRDFPILMCTVSLVGAGVFLVAQIMGASNPSRLQMFSQQESIRMRKMAQGRRYIVFSCVSCPACKTMYDLVLRKPMSVFNNLVFSYAVVFV